MRDKRIKFKTPDGVEHDDYDSAVVHLGRADGMLVAREMAPFLLMSGDDSLRPEDVERVAARLMLIPLHMLEKYIRARRPPL